MYPSLLESTQPLSSAHDLALLDLDGVCYRGAQPVAHAAEGLREAKANGMALSYVTNNAGRTPRSVAAQLTELDIPTQPEQIMTASISAATNLRKRYPAGSLMLAIGGEGLRVALVEAGFELAKDADENPVAVVQGLDKKLGWAELSESAFAIQRGAEFVATNNDATLPIERGQALGNGALIAAVEHATGVKARPGGKPHPDIFHQTIEIHGGKNPLAIGDRLNTDIAGAQAADIPGLHVLTGVSDARDVIEAIPAQRPNYLAVDLRGLNQPHPCPTPDSEGQWVCRQAVAKVENQRLRLWENQREIDLGGERATISLNGWRALACAAWEASDDGEKLTRLPLLEVVG